MTARRIATRALQLAFVLVVVAGIGCKRQGQAQDAAVTSSSEPSANPASQSSDAELDKQLEAPTLDVKDDRVVLNGKESFSCYTTTMRPITLLGNQLAQNPAVWKLRHASGRFDDVELPTVRVDDGMGIVPVASVLMTVADAGYPRISLVAGGRTLTIRWHTTPPSVPVRDTLEVSQRGPSGFRLSFRRAHAPSRPARAVASADAIGPALAETCPPSDPPCAELVVFAAPPTATFASIVPALRATLESGPLRSGVHLVDFSLPGHLPAQPSDEPTESTWGR